MIIFLTELSACSVTSCTRHYRDDKVMVINFTTKNLQQNYYGCDVTAICNNKTIEVCSIPFWRPSNTGTCYLLSPTTSNYSITVKNGKQYQHSQVKLVLHKKASCIQGNSDHSTEIEVLNAGKVSFN